MKKLKTYVFSAIVILIISFSDEAESKSMVIDQRLERAVEAWRNGTSLAQADIDTSDSDATNASTASDRQAVVSGGITDPSTGPDRQAVVSGGITHPETGIKYGCYWNKCWRSCREGEQDPDGWWKKMSPASSNYEWQKFCKNDQWCYSDLGSCSYNAHCVQAVKWGCYGTGYGRDEGLLRGRTIIGARPSSPCYPRFPKYYCDIPTGQSFGCTDSDSKCWRSCDPWKDSYCWRGRRYGTDKQPIIEGMWCQVDAGFCSIDERCIIATVLVCDPNDPADTTAGDNSPFTDEERDMD